MKKIFIESVFALASCGVWGFAQTTAPQSGNAASQTGQAGTAGTAGAGLTDPEMNTRVHRALMNDTDVGEAAPHIHVTTKNGIVTLHGKVQTSAERDAAVAKAKQIAGDANVKDELKIEKP
jgi:hyperosmotically inducible periplasmic protein